jgi:ribonuclease BN (tRNA processing enzyme)
MVAPSALRGAGAETAKTGGSWITLGTIGGPLANAHRSQPANALLADQAAILVDAGDGTVEQLAKADIPLARVHIVVLSHLHWDHTAGLQAVLGLRYQTDTPGKLRIYGPPGTAALVAGLVASMRPAAEAGYGDPNAARVEPGDTVEVTELADGGKVALTPTITMIAVQNAHYSFPAGSELDRKFKSFSYRFQLPGRSIVYTGDTGPSPAVEQLAHGADLLVSEMIDVPTTVAAVRRNVPGISEKQLAAMSWHLSTHHLTPTQVGELAKRGGVGRVVITHMVPGDLTAADKERYLGEIRKNYSGPAVIADDLDRF